MFVLIAKFDQLTLNTEENEKNILYGYICKVKSSKNYFACENDFYVVPDQSGSKFQNKQTTTSNIELALYANELCTHKYNLSVQVMYGITV